MLPLQTQPPGRHRKGRSRQGHIQDEAAPPGDVGCNAGGEGFFCRAATAFLQGGDACQGRVQLAT
jgi:hypothetical protein